MIGGLNDKKRVARLVGGRGNGGGGGERARHTHDNRSRIGKKLSLFSPLCITGK